MSSAASNTIVIIKLMTHLGWFPFECLWQICILITFQEKASRIYETYIKSIKHQNRKVSIFSPLLAPGRFLSLTLIIIDK